jgi:nucleoside-diphosphate-sugar epimerase
MKRILVTGALGQIGSELCVELRQRHGEQMVVASDVRTPPDDPRFVSVDVTDAVALDRAVVDHEVDTIYHLAALLSATAERDPQRGWKLNMDGLFAVLEVARERGCRVFFPSSIAAFGPSTPRVWTPQDTVQRPSTMYGITKVAGELLCDHYHRRFGVDARGVRFPGLISSLTPPGGGTTDYAVAIYHEALERGRYTCYLAEGTRLDMMYMPDALAAAIGVMDAPAEQLIHRNAFNVAAMSVAPEDIAAAIRVHMPDFEIDYEVDPMRQAIAESWPESLDDRAAREEWGWSPRWNLADMTTDMLARLREAKAGRMS